MKNKIIMAFALIGCQTSFAYISGKVPTETKAIYCPAAINCTSNSLDSCKSNSTDEKYFGRPQKSGVIAGRHTFSYVREKKGVDDGGCFYAPTGSNLILPFKPAANLVSYNRKQPPSSWKNGQCGLNNAELCPLKEDLGFVIRNANIPEIILGSINDKVISNIKLKSYEKISWADTLADCGNEKECTIDFFSKNQKYGSVRVDTDSMKILEVNSLDPKKFQIHKVDLFNAVEIIKIDKEKDAIYCPPEITCTGNTVSSCSFHSPDANYFGEMTGSAQAGTWGFYGAFYGVSPPSNPSCVYHGVYLSIKPKMALESYYTKPDSVWGEQRRDTWCIDSAALCPFKHLDGVAIYNANIAGLKAAIAGKFIKSFYTDQSLGITRDDASPGCDDKKECVIDLLSSQNVKYGSVKVDTNSMKILEVNSLYPSKIEINKIADSLNTVEIGYSY